MTYDTLVAPEDVPALYKVTGPDGGTLHGGSGTWPLPRCYHPTAASMAGCVFGTGHVRVGDGYGIPGEWWDVAGDIAGCRNGLHVTDAAHLGVWTRGAGPVTVHRVETRGPVYRVGDGDKYVCGSARLLPRTNRRTGDPVAIYARRDAAIARAERRKVRAERTLRRTLGDGWAVMVSRLGGRVWDGVPERVATACGRYTAECNAADAAIGDAIRKCNAAMARAIMPD